jgi:hypothetical protein
LKRTSTPFIPSFEITYQGFTALSTPPEPEEPDENGENGNGPGNGFGNGGNGNGENGNGGNGDEPEPEPEPIIPPYVPTDYAGDVTVGALRLVPDVALQSGSVVLRASYVPRHIRRILINYRANWDIDVTMLSTGPGEILQNWTLSETAEEDGTTWLELLSPTPDILANSLPFAAMGNLVRFTLRDMSHPRDAFSLFEVDNSIYANIGGQSLVVENAAAFLTEYPALPFGTPVPWLIAHGFTEDFEAAELSDPDGDGIPTWKEYRANTDPRDPDSRFMVHPVSFDPFGRPEIAFSTALNRTYRLEYSSDLITWQIVQDGIIGAGETFAVIDPRFLHSNNRMFYRVLVQ